jgi:regulator of nucleoside diphosphate kinase
METAPPIERTLTQIDFARLSGLLARSASTPSPAAETMQDLLDNSVVMPSPNVPSTVVTMHTQVVVEDLEQGTTQQITLCYPQDAAPAAGHVSVLSPMGAALLGRRSGEVAHWQVPGGGQRSARIGAIVFQPEAAGDFLR